MNPLLAEAIELMTVGMGVVFAFLFLLVGAISLMSRLVARFAPDSAPAPVVSSASLPAQVAPGLLLDTRTLTVIREAVRRHREAN